MIDEMRLPLKVLMEPASPAVIPLPSLFHLLSDPPLVELSACGRDLMISPTSDGKAFAVVDYFECGQASARLLPDLRLQRAASRPLPGKPYTFTVGEDGPNIVIGGPGPNFMAGRGGRDVLLGGGGDDVLDGGDDVDFLYGSSGDDHLVGGAGNDYLYGEVDGDTLLGDDGSDLLVGGTGHDTLHGGGGDDTLRGGADRDVLDGGPGNDLLCGGSGNDIYHFGKGGGHDVIDDRRPYSRDAAPFDGDWVIFGKGITPDQLWFARSGADLKITLTESGDTLTLHAWYAGQTSGVGLFVVDGPRSLQAGQVDTLVQAMAAYEPPAIGSTELALPRYGGLMSVLGETWV